MARHSLHFIAQDPLIAVTYGGGAVLEAAEKVAARANGTAAYLLLQPSWHGPAQLPDILRAAKLVAAIAPNVRMTVAAATPEDDLLFRRSGLSSIWCNHNAFLDERIFHPEPDREKLYDAVYVGRLVRMKRHELAAHVPRMAIISGRYEFDEAYATACISAFDDLRYVNFEPGSGRRQLSAEEVREVLVASRCGLALSELEGAMYASAEYLLCGLPVVTTPSKGGRDVFFHPDYVETVEPSQDAVAEAVARLNARNLDPWTIHRRTLELAKPHRIRLLMWMSGILQQNLFQVAGENLWLPSFVNKLADWSG